MNRFENVSSDTVYAGIRDNDGNKRIVTDQLPEDLDSHPTYQHGVLNGVKTYGDELPTEGEDKLNAEWGYIGEGPQDTAQVILQHAYDKEVAEEYRSNVMRNLISPQEGDEEWFITASDIHETVEERLTP